VPFAGVIDPTWVAVQKTSPNQSRPVLLDLFLRFFTLKFWEDWTAVLQGLVLVQSRVQFFGSSMTGLWSSSQDQICPSSLMAYFHPIRFYLSSSFSEEHSAQLWYLLSRHGGKEENSISATTHVITDTNHFEGCQDIRAGTHVMTVCVARLKIFNHLKPLQDMWVERSVMFQKLQSPSGYSPDPAMIFSGVVAYVLAVHVSF
jgi:hypothetical protein